MDLGLYWARGVLFKLLLWLAFRLRCVHGHCRLVHSNNVLQNCLRLVLHQFNERHGGPHPLSHLLLGQELGNPMGRLLYEA